MKKRINTDEYRGVPGGVIVDSTIFAHEIAHDWLEYGIRWNEAFFPENQAGMMRDAIRWWRTTR